MAYSAMLLVRAAGLRIMDVSQLFRAPAVSFIGHPLLSASALHLPPADQVYLHVHVQFSLGAQL
jgi:hypothetical protein